MKCPTCGESKWKVEESRQSAISIRRRRTCLVCGQKITTHERITSIKIAKI